MSNRRCQSVQELLSAYSDQQLPAEKQTMVAGHLAQCPTCRCALGQLQQLDAVLPLWVTPAVNPQLSARFAVRLAQRELPTSWVYQLLPRLAWAGALLVTMCVLSYLSMSNRQRPTASTARPVISTASLIAMPRVAVATPIPASHTSDSSKSTGKRQVMRKHQPESHRSRQRATPALPLTIRASADEASAIVACISEVPHGYEQSIAGNGYAVTVAPAACVTADDPMPMVIASLTETE